MAKEQPLSDLAPGACKESWFPGDDSLRRHGCRIHARPKGEEAVWRLPDGEMVSFSEAVESLPLYVQE